MASRSQDVKRKARVPESAITQELCKSLMSLKGVEECESFLVDLCTPEELRSLSERWRVAKLLDQGIPYRKIYELTGISTATITRVARALLYGQGGYQRALEIYRAENTKKAGRNE